MSENMNDVIVIERNEVPRGMRTAQDEKIKLFGRLRDLAEENKGLLEQNIGIAGDFRELCTTLRDHLTQAVEMLQEGRTKVAREFIESQIAAMEKLVGPTRDRTS